MEGGWKTPLPRCYTSQKSSVLIGLSQSENFHLPSAHAYNGQILAPDLVFILGLVMEEFKIESFL